MKQFLSHLFIPQESNNHRAKVLHHRIIFVFLLFFLVSPQVRAYLNSEGVLGTSSSVSASQLAMITNAERQKSGLAGLSQNELLARAAESKARDMFEKNYWAHVSPDGTTPWFFIKQAGYEYIYAGENLAKGFNTAEDVVRAWMNSPTHRDNILSENYEDVGFSVSEGSLLGENTTLVVQEFGGKALVPPPNEEKKEVVESKKIEEEITPQSINILGAPRIQSSSVSQKIVFLSVLALFIILVIDMIFAHKRKIIRLAGHNLDHLLLFVFMIILFSVLFRGVVL